MVAPRAFRDALHECPVLCEVGTEMQVEGYVRHVLKGTPIPRTVGAANSVVPSAHSLIYSGRNEMWFDGSLECLARLSREESQAHLLTFDRPAVLPEVVVTRAPEDGRVSEHGRDHRVDDVAPQRAWVGAGRGDVPAVQAKGAHSETRNRLAPGTASSPSLWARIGPPQTLRIRNPVAAPKSLRRRGDAARFAVRLPLEKWWADAGR